MSIKEPSKVCWDLAALTLNITWKMKFSVNDFFGRNEQIYSKLYTCSHLLKKSFVTNLISCCQLWANFSS